MKIKISKEQLNLKEYIFNNYNQITIISNYISIKTAIITEDKIRYCIDNNIKIRNPFRKDIHPSLTFYYNDIGKLITHDFANGLYRGDIFDVVGWRLNISSSDAKGFIAICKHIKETIKIGNVDKSIIGYTKQIKTITIKLRSYTKYDLFYWSRTGVNIIKEPNVFPVGEAYENDNRIFYHLKAYNPCYAYYKGRDIDDNAKKLYKLYIPNAPKGSSKFYSNNNQVIDLRGFFGGDIAIITKSDKDRLVLKSSIERIEKKSPLFIGGKQDYIAHISNVDSESTFLTKGLIDYLQNNYTYIVLNLDFDRIGLIAGFYYHMVFGIDIYYIGNDYDYTKFPQKDLLRLLEKIKRDSNIQILHTQDFIKFIQNHIGQNKEKDFYDYAKKHGVLKLDELISSKFKNYGRELEISNV